MIFTLRSLPSLLLLAALGAQPPAPGPSPLSPAPPDPVQLVLRARLPASGAAPGLTLAGESFRASPDLACFYQRRQFAPAWSEGEAQIGRASVGKECRWRWWPEPEK